jgi:PAS domain S-box-containing protein
MALEAATVLVVDDNPDNLGVLYELLSGQGYRVLVAEDGAGALEQAALARPELILLDIMLPDRDGFSVCQALKGSPATREIPVVFMTALTDTADKVRGLRLGAVDYVTKPFQHEEVLARVATHLSLERLRAELQRSEARLSGVLGSAMDAIVTVDRQGRVTMANPAAEGIFGRDADTLLGEPVDGLLAQELATLVKAFADGEGAAQMWVPQGHSGRRADGQGFAIEGTLSRSVAAGERLCTLILRDVESLRRAEAERSRLQGLSRYLEQELRAAEGVADMVGESRALAEVLDQARQVAPTDATVLVTGETGTGKELVARAVHALSPRREQVLVKLNCAAIPTNLVESELFGHEKGAFTGALARKAGRFELAHGGTLFLDEVAELPVDLQAKLLRVLQEGELERVGGTRTVQVDVRIVAATNQDLAARVKEGTFRADLFYRLNVFPLHLPPLRERREDIPALVGHFARHYAARYGKGEPRVAPESMARLAALDWPGNVRELQHAVERAVILSRDGELVFDLEEAPVAGAEARTEPALMTLDEAQRSHILEVLEAVGWRVSGSGGAAEVLGVKPTTLESRMKRLGIARPR